MSGVLGTYVKGIGCCGIACSSARAIREIEEGTFGGFEVCGFGLMKKAAVESGVCGLDVYEVSKGVESSVSVLSKPHRV